MKEAYHKISIDFEYSNEIYNINSDPYNSLSELKDKVSKKIFPHPGNIHCFYKNLDLFDKEDEEIAKIFPNKSKITIKLKNPPTVKPFKKPFPGRRSKKLLTVLEPPPQFPTISPTLSPQRTKTKTIRKKKDIIRILTSCSMSNTKTESNPSINLNNNKINEEAVNDSIKNNDLFYYLHKSTVDKYKKPKKLTKIENEQNVKSIMDKYKSSKINSNFLTDIKGLKDLNTLLSNLKPKNLNSYQFNKNLNPKFNTPKITNDRYKKIIKAEKYLLKPNLNLDISLDDKETNEEKYIANNKEKKEEEVNSDNKDHIDENYICTSCKNEIISEYCLICNEFKCNSCIELCKVDEHEHLKIKLDSDCFKIINSYGEFITSNLDKKHEEFLELNNEIELYDIKKFRDNMISLINDIINAYNEIINVLENIYKERPLQKEIIKLETESINIKKGVNEILNKAKNYLKSDVDTSIPKNKMMNMKYFFNLLNEKEKSYHSFIQNMKVYSLNMTINSNMKKCFNEIEDLMKSITKKENAFSLKDDLKKEYEQLIQKTTNLKIDKRKVFKKRKTLSVKPINFPNFPRIAFQKADENNSEELPDI